MDVNEYEKLYPKVPVLGSFEHTHIHRQDDQRKDSVELGPAHARVKVYCDLTAPDAAKALVAHAIELSQWTAAELRTAGLIKEGK